MIIQQLKEATPKALQDINGLLKQLVHDPKAYAPVQLSAFREIARDKNIVFVVARDGARIIGIGLLIVVTKFRGRYGYIEDMLVDKAYRGRGYGKEIALHLMRAAKKRGITTLELSTRPSRIPANNLYKKLGFQRKDTNVYRLHL